MLVLLAYRLCSLGRVVLAGFKAMTIRTHTPTIIQATIPAVGIENEMIKLHAISQIGLAAHVLRQAVEWPFAFALAVAAFERRPFGGLVKVSTHLERNFVRKIERLLRSRLELGFLLLWTLCCAVLAAKHHKFATEVLQHNLGAELLNAVLVRPFAGL
jgi:hypothetical protein